jgi:hypothetical protein
VQKRFDTVVDDLAQAIATILRALETGTGPASKGFIYLGETSSDIDGDREQLRRSLLQRGYAVLPEAPLRLRNGPDVRRIVARNLKECRLAVYPVGAYYGPVLEGASGQSITELQLETTLHDARNGMITRMVWVPPGLQMMEERQRELLGHIRAELPGQGFEIVERPLTEIETHITDRLERPPSAGYAPAEDPADGPEIYLMCVPEDRDSAKVVRDVLFTEGFEVRLPPTTNEAYAALHARRLETADAFVVFWGTADERWLEPVVSELKRAKGLRKGKPILSRAIFLADPPTPEKREYLTRQAIVLPGFSSTALQDALQPLLAELRRSRSGNAV